jgi:hypothetical protein
MHAHCTAPYVNQHVLIARTQILQHACVVQKRQVRHVLGLEVLGRIHFLTFVLFQCSLQSSHRHDGYGCARTHLAATFRDDGHGGSLVLGDLRPHIALLGVWYPEGLLCVILDLALVLHVQWCVSVCARCTHREQLLSRLLQILPSGVLCVVHARSIVTRLVCAYNCRPRISQKRLQNDWRRTETRYREVCTCSYRWSP